MKKYILIGALGLFSLASCKKDYTCECTSTYSNNGVASSPYTSSTTLTKVTKRTAQSSSECVSYSNTSTYISGSSGNLQTNVYTTDCTIKKK